MKPQSAKAKGRKLQQAVIKVLIEELGIDEGDIENRSMGAGGEDIILSNAAREKFPFSVECKNTEKLNIWSALSQAEENCKGHPPVVIFKRNRSKTYACIEFETLINLLKGKK